MITTRISITSNSDDDTASFLHQLIILLEQTDVEHADGSDSEGQSFSFDTKRTDTNQTIIPDLNVSQEGVKNGAQQEEEDDDLPY